MMANPSSRDLQGLRAAVLGSTSGIGRAVALALAEAGADVIVHGRSSREAAEEVAAEVRRLGGRSHVLMADLADRDAGDRLVDEAWDALGRARRLAPDRRGRHPDRRRPPGSRSTRSSTRSGPSTSSPRSGSAATSAGG